MTDIAGAIADGPAAGDRECAAAGVANVDVAIIGPRRSGTVNGYDTGRTGIIADTAKLVADDPAVGDRECAAAGVADVEAESAPSRSVTVNGYDTGRTGLVTDIIATGVIYDSPADGDVERSVTRVANGEREAAVVVNIIMDTPT